MEATWIWHPVFILLSKSKCLPRWGSSKDAEHLHGPNHNNYKTSKCKEYFVRLHPRISYKSKAGRYYQLHVPKDQFQHGSHPMRTIHRDERVKSHQTPAIKTRKGMLHHYVYPYSISCSESSIACYLRCEPVRLSERRWGLTTNTRAGGNHEPVSAENWCIVLFDFVRLLSKLAFLIILLQGLDSRALLSKVVNHEGHGEVGEAIAPRDFHYNMNRN